MAYRLLAELKDEYPEILTVNDTLDAAKIRIEVEDPVERQEIFDKVRDNEPKPTLLDETYATEEETITRAKNLLLRNETDLVRILDEGGVLLGTFRFEFGFIKWTNLAGRRDIPLHEAIEKQTLSGLTV